MKWGEPPKSVGRRSLQRGILKTSRLNLVTQTFTSLNAEKILRTLKNNVPIMLRKKCIYLNNDRKFLK